MAILQHNAFPWRQWWGIRWPEEEVLGLGKGWEPASSHTDHQGGPYKYKHMVSHVPL